MGKVTNAKNYLRAELKLYSLEMVFCPTAHCCDTVGWKSTRFPVFFFLPANLLMSLPRSLQGKGRETLECVPCPSNSTLSHLTHREVGHIVPNVVAKVSIK